MVGRCLVLLPQVPSQSTVSRARLFVVAWDDKGALPLDGEVVGACRASVLRGDDAHGAALTPRLTPAVAKEPVLVTSLLVNTPTKE